MRPPHILVADDERAICQMLETGLALSGFNVTCVGTGHEAAAAAASQVFDAVLADVYMPDGTGLELAEELRATNPTLPIVLMTARGSLDAAVEAVSHGASDFIAKPFLFIELAVKALLYVLRRRLQPGAK